MAEIVVVGAGLIGLSTALRVARDGHRVTVLETDPAAPPPPERAWDDWERPGVNHFRLVHLMLPRWTAEMQREVPAVIDRMAAAGAPRFNVLQALPTSWSGGPRSGDDRFDTVTAPPGPGGAPRPGGGARPPPPGAPPTPRPPGRAPPRP